MGRFVVLLLFNFLIVKYVLFVIKIRRIEKEFVILVWMDFIIFLMVLR